MAYDQASVKHSIDSIQVTEDSQITTPTSRSGSTRLPTEREVKDTNSEFAKLPNQ